ncbi:hypothetical protein JCM8097_009115 [Rhodosporidiobolus ruineniae]
MDSSQSVYNPFDAYTAYPSTSSSAGAAASTSSSSSSPEQLLSTYTFPHRSSDSSTSTHATAASFFNPTYPSPYFRRRSDSPFSTASSLGSADVADSSHFLPFSSTVAPNQTTGGGVGGVGAQRRTPLYRAARQANPYSRRSSVASNSSNASSALGDDQGDIGLEGPLAGLYTDEPEQIVPLEQDHPVLARGGGSLGAAGALASLASGDAEDRRRVHEAETALQEAADTSHEAITATAKDKARTAFVQTWLTKNYEPAVGGSVTRQALFGSYTKASEKYGVKALNTASFGKAVRQAYPNLTVRRLGTRGHSRYHLMNFRASNSVEAALVESVEEEIKRELAAAEGGSESSGASEESGTEEVEVKSEEEEEKSSPIVHNASRRPPNPRSLSISIPPGSTPFDEHKTVEPAAVATAVPRPLFAPLPHPLRQPGIEEQAPLSLPQGFPAVEEILQQAYRAGQPVDEGLVRVAWTGFERYCKQHILEWFSHHSLNEIWLLQHPVVSSFFVKGLGLVYENILNGLHDKLTTQFAPEAGLEINSLANNLESVQTMALAAFSSPSFVNPVVELASQFGEFLRRWMGTKKLVTALGGMLARPGVEGQVAQTWAGIDFSQMSKHVALVGGVDPELLTSLSDDFGRFLNSTRPLTVPALIRWFDTVWERYSVSLLAAGIEVKQAVMAKAAMLGREVMRELTLRDMLAFRLLAPAVFHPPPPPTYEAASVPRLVPLVPNPPAHPVPSPTTARFFTFRTLLSPPPAQGFTEYSYATYQPAILPQQQQASGYGYQFSPSSASFLQAQAVQMHQQQSQQQQYAQPFPSPSSSFFLTGGGGGGY